MARERIVSAEAQATDASPAGSAVPTPAIRPRRLDDYVGQRGLVERLPHPIVDTIPTIRSPIRMTDTPIIPANAPPMLAQHTDEILGGVLGYDAARITNLKDSGAVA